MADRNGKVTLREARERKGYSRERAAAHIEISAKTLERWEDPEQRPARMKLYQLEKLAELYGVSVDVFEEAA